MTELYKSQSYEKLTGYWPLNGNANDAVGSNNGTGTAITYSTAYGKYNQGGDWNGSTSEIALTSRLNTLSGNWSITFWGNPDAVVNYNYYLSSNNTASGFDTWLIRRTSGSTFFVASGSVWGTEGGYWQWTPSSVLMTAGKWNFMGLTSNSSTITFYVGDHLGNLEASSAISFTVAYGSGTKSADGPQYFGHGSQYYSGSMDDIGWFDGNLLTAGEIEEIYQDVLAKKSYSYFM
jgi:hypothetical protein